jgi:hypothetical protein
LLTTPFFSSQNDDSSFSNLPQLENELKVGFTTPNPIAFAKCGHAPDLLSFVVFCFFFQGVEGQISNNMNQLNNAVEELRAIEADIQALQQEHQSKQAEYAKKQQDLEKIRVGTGRSPTFWLPVTFGCLLQQLTVLLLTFYPSRSCRRRSTT